MKNFGLDLQREVLEISEEDYTLGGFGPTLTCIAEIPVNERLKYLPGGESQKNENFDTMDCASRSVLNILETKLNYMLDKGLFIPEIEEWLIDNGYFFSGKCELSDRFIAIKSGTDPLRGNSLKAPCDAVHRYGVLPKHLLPFTEGMTQDEYHSGITEEMEWLAEQFIKRITVSYERVMQKDFGDNMLDVGGFAWTTPSEGIYGRTDLSPNHAFMRIASEHTAFDNYRDSFDGDFIKRLSTDYKFIDYGYNVMITSQQIPKVRYWFVDIFLNIIKLWK